MGSKLSAKDTALYEAVDEVLHYIWDPIGVRDVPQARDEYHDYVPQVFKLLREGKGAESIADFLGTIRTETIGLSENSKRNLIAAQILVNWREAIDEKLA